MPLLALLPILLVALFFTPPVLAQSQHSPSRSVGAPSQPAPLPPLLFEPGTRTDRPDTSTLRVIRFLTDDDYPPFHFVGPDGQLTGFNVEIARAICLELRIACTIQARRWDTLIPALEENRGDAVIASLAITDAARARLDFTVPYYRTPARFVVPQAPPATIPAVDQASEPSRASLAGRRVAVVRGSAHAAFLAVFFAEAEAVMADDWTGALDLVRRGEVAAGFGDGIGAAIWLNGEQAAGCCRFWGGPYLESRYFGEGVAIAVARGNIALRRALEFALQRLGENGTYADIYFKYFPIGFY